MTEHVLPSRRAALVSRPRLTKAVLIPALVLGAVVLLTLAIRLILDPVATHETRKALDQLDGFAGDFERVHVTLFGPGYDITHVKLIQTARMGAHPTVQARKQAAVDRRRALDEREPLIYIERAHVGINWRELLHLRVVASLRLEQPKVVVQAGPEKAPPQTAQRAPDLSDQLEQITALKVDRIDILGGEFVFRAAPGPRPPELWLHRLDAVAQNLATRDALAKGRPATVSAHGMVGRSGDLTLFVSADPLASPLSFAGQVSLKGLRAAELYQFLAPKTKLQASAGTIDVFAEFVSKEGAITGGIKPVLKNIEISPVDGGVGDRLKAWLADKTVAIASDRVPGRNAVATVIPIKGELTAPDVQLWPTVLGVIRNAFVQGLASGFGDVPPPTAPEKQGVLTQAKNALKKDQGPPKAQPVAGATK